jgi:hypothetical protein
MAYESRPTSGQEIDAGGSNSNTYIYIQMETKTNALNRLVKWKTAALSALAVASLASTPALAGNKDEDEFKFDMVRNTQFDGQFHNFARNARGRVKIESVGPVEIMDVIVWGLPPNTDFDFFVIQVPTAPFGLAWYQGDIETNKYGVGHERFVGRYSIETYIVALPPSQPAPVVHFDDPQPFPDADHNPTTNPVQLYHLGLWFNNPADAVAAGGPANVTPFNGEHNAGVQVLNTSNFLPPVSDFGPLHQVSP